MSPNCDKCGRRVPPHNDAVNLDLNRNNDDVGDRVVMYDSRHLLPVIENGVVVCEGSPSRAQYLIGQPRDPRGKHPYIPREEREIRSAYKQLLQQHPIPS